MREILEAPVDRYAPAPLPIRCRLIPVIYGQVRIRRHRLAERFPSIDAWAVPVHKVTSRQGKFRSRDLKDYLGLPPDRKLILSTCAPDDYQEMLWKRGPEMDYERHGIDYWFPGHFSIYDDDSKLYQFISAKRQQLHAVRTRSQFVWFRLGDGIPLDFLEPVRQASSVLLSSQQVFHRNHRAAFAEEVRVADAWLPPGAALFIVGGIWDLPIPSSRKRYNVNTRWLVLALKGRNLANRPQPDRATGELLEQNLKEVLDHVHPTDSNAGDASHQVHGGP
jgi:hypothetical protein